MIRRWTGVSSQGLSNHPLIGLRSQAESQEQPRRADMTGKLRQAEFSFIMLLVSNSFLPSIGETPSMGKALFVTKGHKALPSDFPTRLRIVKDAHLG